MSISKIQGRYLVLLLICAVTVQASLWNKKSKSPGTVTERKEYWYNEVSGASQWAEPKYEFLTDKNTTYYLDPVTNETAWERPESLAWVSVEDEEGKTYYYNEKTGKSQWEKPLQLAWKLVPVTADSEIKPEHDYEL